MQIIIASLISFQIIYKHNYSFNLEIIHYCRHPASFKFKFPKLRILEILNFHPMDVNMVAGTEIAIQKVKVSSNNIHILETEFTL